MIPAVVYFVSLSLMPLFTNSFKVKVYFAGVSFYFNRDEVTLEDNVDTSTVSMIYYFSVYILHSHPPDEHYIRP